LAKSIFLAGIVAGGWDAAVDSWANLKKREIDIHFLMLAVALGAMVIGAWGEAVSAPVPVLGLRGDGGIRA
jgi:Cd2+/Zn2+-exporting ATPase